MCGSISWGASCLRRWSAAAPRETSAPTSVSAAVERVRALADFDYAGADFLRDGERYLLNELEDVVGARMLYTHTELDPIAAFVSHIRRELSTK